MENDAGQDRSYTKLIKLIASSALVKPDFLQSFKAELAVILFSAPPASLAVQNNTERAVNEPNCNNCNAKYLFSRDS